MSSLLVKPINADLKLLNNEEDWHEFQSQEMQNWEKESLPWTAKRVATVTDLQDYLR